MFWKFLLNIFAFGGARNPKTRKETKLREMRGETPGPFIRDKGL